MTEICKSWISSTIFNKNIPISIEMNKNDMKIIFIKKRIINVIVKSKEYLQEIYFQIILFSIHFMNRNEFILTDINLFQFISI